MEADESVAAAAAAEKTKEEIEVEITKAMLSRLDDFKQQADNFTLEGVRRALEEDLGMERLSLDAYKKFIKQCLEKYFYGDDGKNASETEGKVVEPVQPVKKEVLQPEEDLRESSSDPSKNLEGFPGVGGHEQADKETEKSLNGTEHGSEINEDTIKKAIRKRAPYFRSNLEITLGKVRRLLEEDLKLEKNSLDAFKKFISNELDAILQSDEVVQATNGAKKKPKKTSKIGSTGKTSKVAKKPSKYSDSSDSDDVSSEEEEDEETRNPKKRPAQKNKVDTKGLKRQKVSTQRSKASGSGKKRPAGADSGKSSDESNGGKTSEDDRSQSSGEEEEVKKKNEKPAQVYGKRVEHLKSIIKSCGMGIPPSVYKRVKQVPESKREAHLIKELEEILEREGLSTDPSEKEIKAVKKRKERVKELEGIDMSNIVSSSRRRTTSTYIPPPKPKVEAGSDEDEEGEEEEEEDNEEDSDDGDSDGEESSGGSGGDDAEEESD